MNDLPKFSLSEEHGLRLITDSDLLIFSPGISTGGVAEIRIAEQHPHTRVFATTLDKDGLSYAQMNIGEQGLSDRISATLEDLRGDWHYLENYFNFIYARLVLHYLSVQDLKRVLDNLFLSLKHGGRIFIVVRSVKNFNVKSFEVVAYDEDTRLTTYRRKGESTDPDRKRYFHTPETIKGHLENSGFLIKTAKEYEEQLYKDFMRTVPSPDTDHLIEVLASKP
jgi:SAM-dependent methyltransferase